ncbi:MAG: LptF/LptG family permease [Candidatus Firestonebacteria bacterium]
MKSPKILYWYISSEFIKTFLLSLISLTIIVLVTEFFDEIKGLLECNPAILSIIKYFFYKIPYTALKATPFAALIATLFSLHNFARNNETIAMQANGLSLFKIILPFLVISFILSLIVIVINETLAANMYSKSTLIKYKDIFKTEISYSATKNNLSFKSKEGWIAYIKLFNGERNFMRDVTIIFFDKENNLLKRIDAKEGIWNGKNWDFKNCYMREFLSTPHREVVTTFSSITLPITEKPEDFVKKRKKIEEFTIKELSNEINKLKTNGAKYNEESVNLHFKISYAFSTFILTLLGIPFGVKTGKHRSVILSFFLSFFIGFLYWQLLVVGYSLGKYESLPPIIASWLGNIVFTVIGTVMLFI